MEESELLHKIFLEDMCMSTDDPLHYYVPDDIFRTHKTDLEYLKKKGYKFSLSMVMEKDGEKFGKLK